MPQSCCVQECSAKYGRNIGLKFHGFPKDQDLRKKWAVTIRTGKSISKWAKVCSRHFNENDYIVTSLGEWRILRSDAIPSKHLPIRSHDRKTDERTTLRMERSRRRAENSLSECSAGSPLSISHSDPSPSNSNNAGPIPQHLQVCVKQENFDETGPNTTTPTVHRFPSLNVPPMQPHESNETITSDMFEEEYDPPTPAECTTHNREKTDVQEEVLLSLRCILQELKLMREVFGQFKEEEIALKREELAIRREELALSRLRSS